MDTRIAVLGSVGSIAAAAALLSFPKRVRERLVPLLVSYATGTLLAAAVTGLLPLGIATGIAVIAHEWSQEVGDFAVLLESGFDRMQALRWNLLSGTATIPGAVLAYVTLGSMQGIVGPTLALSAASFIYIGLADVVPGLHRRIGPEPGFAQWLSSWPVSGRCGAFS